MKSVVIYQSFVGLLLALICFLINVSAQNKAAFLTPQENPVTEIAVEKLKEKFSKNFKIIDDSIGEAVFRSHSLETPFNLTTEQSKNLGKAVGCDVFLLIKGENMTRTSLEKGTFQEAFAAVFAVSTRTGKLLYFRLVKAEELTSKEVEKTFATLAEIFAEDFAAKTQTFLNQELNATTSSNIADIPPENSSEAKNFRPPLPFRRIKPEYTLLANLYSVTATIDVAVEIDADGKVLRTEILRWAGFGLDESVDETIKKMNWRPAERNGKTLPMRVLLRYNFKKVERED